MGWCCVGWCSVGWCSVSWCCVSSALDLPPATRSAASLAALARRVALDDIGASDAPLRNRGHATAGTFDKGHQRALLLNDTVVGAVLSSLRRRARALWRSGKLRTCGDFDDGLRRATARRSAGMAA